MGSRKAMQNSDGDFLVVVQEGGLVVETEMGLLRVDAGEIFVVPRGYYLYRLIDLVDWCLSILLYLY